jgi:serine/threonine-protein kinase
MVQVPNVYTLEADSAKSMLEAQDFKVVIKSVVNEAQKNTVIETQPARDEMAQYGSTVVMVVSRGPEEQDVIMPDVVGKPIETAKKMLAALLTLNMKRLILLKSWNRY